MQVYIATTFPACKFLGVDEILGIDFRTEWSIMSGIRNSSLESHLFGGGGDIVNKPDS